MRRIFAVALGASLVLVSPTGAFAQDKPKSDTEFDIVPIAGGSSDIGIGGGAVGALTRFGAPVTEQNEGGWGWRFEGSAFATVRVSPRFASPYQDYWLLLTLPDLDDGKLRLTARVAFTEETNVRYYGIGNSTPLPPDWSSPRYEYTRTHPTLESYARVLLEPHLFVTLGASFTANWLDVPPDGKLAIDMRTGPPEVRALLGTARTAGVAFAQASVSWDDRDDEVVPRRGTWDEVNLRLSPDVGGAMPYGYAEILAIARDYIPVGSRVVVALRGLADALIGDPPFFNLALYDDTYAIGGTAGIRGVPAQRYYGKAKLIGNIEARTDIARFHAIGKPWGIAAVGFLDAGRLWADWSSQPFLDGTGLGLKWGTGVGVRVQQGTAFVVRADVAWSPDARPLGGYFAAGEMF
jgi:outer membrane protein assembly factor BamA